MGAAQSRITVKCIPNEQLVVDRLRALQLRDQQSTEEDYVHVSMNEKGRPRYSRKASGLSVSAVEHWEETLLQDPKNR